MKSEYPPEAYSKELLSEAFNWLQNQPESVRELVQTPENLITIYRNEQKKMQTDAPVSSKQFVSELKSLAKGLEEFDNDGPKTSAVSNSAPAPTPTPAPPPPQKEYSSSPRGKIHQPTSSPKTPMASHDMDPRTRQMVQETRLRFNLTSDAESLRLLVALGHEKLSKI